MYKIISLIVIFPLIIFADWQSLNGPSGGRADDMSMGEYQSEWIIYAADNTYKLYKSDDEGASWQQITHQDIAQPQGVVTDPSDARVVYICKWVSYDNSAIWKSIDGGINWDWVDDNNVTNKHMRCMAIDADRPETLYVAGDSYKNPSNEEQPSVFKSYDGGQNWIQEKIRAVHWPDPYICDISVVSDDLNSIVLAASYEVGFLTSPGVFRKVNEGPWTHAELPYNIGAVALGDMQYAYAGIREGDPGFFRSDDGGDTWEQVFEFPSTYVYDIETRAPFHVWVATADGIYESTDRGATWEPKNDYVLCKYCRHVLVHPDEPNDLFVGANWALYKTTNMGENWFEITNGYPLAKLASVASNDPYIYCLGEAILLGVESSSIFRSPGYGSTWQTLTGAFDTEVTPVAIDVRPSNSSIVLFGGNTVISPPEQDSKGVIFRSNNYGETWSERYRPPTQMSPDNIHALEFCPVNDNRVFAGYDGYPPSSYPIKRSNNTGDTWHQISIPQNPPVYDFCPNPQDNSIIYAGTKQKGVYKSEDDGDNWTQTELDDVDVNALAVDFDFPDTLYAGSADPTGIYKTTNGASSWSPINNGLDYSYITDLAIDPSEPTIVYTLCKQNEIATQTYVYCTVDRGGKWFDVSQGLLANKPAHDLEIDCDEPDPVYAATEDGIYTYSPDFNKSLVSSSDVATSYNNGRNMMCIEGTDEIWVTYESGGVIYVTRTTNGGFSWSKKMELGQGSYPAISYDPIAETPVPGVVWYYRDSENQHYIYFARHITGSQWSDPAVIVTSRSAIDPPSFAIAGGNWGHLAYTEGSAVKYRKFNILNPLPTTPEWVGTGHNPSIGYMISVPNPDIHITWENSDQIWYRREPFGIGFPERVSHPLTTCHHPSLAIEGNVVYFIWEASGDISWRSFTCNHPFYTWGQIKPVCFTISVPSTYPVLTGGHFCSWVEEHTNNYEVYFSHYNPEVGGWTSPQNISNGATETFSNHPHINHYQTLLGTNVYFIWTEGSEAIPQPTAPPYEIKFKTHVFGGLGEGGENALPMYIAQCGEQKPSPFTIRREGYTHYGSEPYKRIDHDGQYLEYQFTHLDSSKTYKIHAYLYQRGSSNLPISINIDGHQFDTIHILPDTLVIIEHVLPELLYKDGQITMKILGNKAVSAILVISEYEKDNKGGGPQGSEALSGIPDCLSLYVYPCPANNVLNIKYTVPISGIVHVSLYDVAGRCVREISHTYGQAGIYQKSLNIRDIPQGVYFLRLESDDEVILKKTVFLR